MKDGGGGGSDPVGDARPAPIPPALSPPAAGSLGPSIWAVSDGRAGNAVQVRAIVQALGEPRRWMRMAHIDGRAHRDAPLTLTPGKPWTWLPSALWVNARAALPAEQVQELKTPWPTIWIGAGRRTAPYSAAIKRWSRGKTHVVHILDPKMAASRFDLIVTPVHDRVSKPGVISTVGSPTYFSQDDQEQAGQAFAHLADEPGPSAIVILGGNSKAYRFTAADADRLVSEMQAITSSGWRLRITTSRRTPAEVVAKMRAFAQSSGAALYTGPDDGPNPYLAWLLFSDAAIVTADSANMLSDAAYHGLPVHIARLKGGSPKFNSFHNSLIKRGCARWFAGELDLWSYEPLREADRVADHIIAGVLRKHPQPELPGIEPMHAVAPAWL
ncbi:MAG: mitochondrial fission ELM1 family protein [Pseudomonadota bacterium]